MINIQEYQVKTKEQEVVGKLLKKGGLVTSYKVTKLVNEFFEHHIPGLPYFKPNKIEYNSKSDKNTYNEMFKSIYEDLKVAYSVFNSQADYAVISQSSYDLEIEKIYKDIDILILQSQILEEYSKRNISYFPYVLSFSDLSNINTKNLSSHNVPYTTSEIDFNTSTLRNELHSTPNDKIDLINSNVRLTAGGFKIKTNKDIKNIINDLHSDPVSVTVNGNLSERMSEITIDLILEEYSDISRVELSGYSLYNTNINLLISNDGDNFLEKNTSQGQPYNVWRFNREKVKAIKFIITKTSFDYENEYSEKIYHYILKNISLYNDKYSKTSVFTSEPIEFIAPISDIVISPIHKKPPGTDISYFIGVEDMNDDVEWKAIKPNKTLDLKLLAKEEMILNYFTSELFGAWDFDRRLKEINFYIHELPENTNLNSVELRAGHSQWLVERLDVTDKYNQEYPPDKKVSTADYSKSRVTEIAPLDATIMDIKCEKKYNYFMLSQNAICENDTIVENRYIKFDKTIEFFDYIVLINGKQVFPKEDKYTFKLRKGENLVQIMMLLGDLNISNLANIKKIKHNFNLMAYCSAIYAGPKMQKISYNSLTKNVSHHSLKYYAIKTVDGRDRVVTKFDPNYVLTPDGGSTVTSVDFDAEYTPQNIKMSNSEYFRVYLKYKNMPKEIKDNLLNKNGNGNIRCRVMAKLSTSDISVTPFINAIKVVGQ